ncbi:MAG: DUF58 domain-containing protein, partial [Gaiellaceae bacterium]
MSRSPKLALYAAFAATSFVAALVLGHPELAGLGAPFALVLAVGLSLPPPPKVRASLHLARERALEGDEIETELSLTASESCEARLALQLPRGIGLVERPRSLVIQLERERPRAVTIKLACERWGAYRLGGLAVRTGDRARLRLRDDHIAARAVLRVYPGQERLQSLVTPLETQPFAGDRVSRAKAEGIEFADIRPYVRGDRVRRLNWRASSRAQALYVNQQHPERNADVILFLDNFAEAQRQNGGTLDLTVRAAATLAEHYLAVQDRVGIVGFGGIVRWLTPASGTLQSYRIAEALLETEVNFSYVWRRIDVLPARSLTPQALVIALSPLLDERGMFALVDLRRRGFDLAVVDVSPIPFAGSEADPPDAQTIRLWRLWRETLHLRYQELGVAVAEW